MAEDDEILTDDEAKFAFDIYEETCICDTPLCNVVQSPNDFFCHGGDYEIPDLIKEPLLLNETHSCYTNRNHCFIMKYKGK